MVNKSNNSKSTLYNFCGYLIMRKLLLILVLLVSPLYAEVRVIRLPAASAVTNTGSDIAIFSTTFTPGYQSLAPGDCIDLLIGVQRTTGSTNVTYKVQLGSTVVTIGVDNNTALRVMQLFICNQISLPYVQEWFFSIMGTTIAGVTTSTIDTSTAALQIRVLSNGASSTAVTPRFFRAIIYPFVP